jgi:hypothetical protein
MLLHEKRGRPVAPMDEKSKVGGRGGVTVGPSPETHESKHSA